MNYLEEYKNKLAQEKEDREKRNKFLVLADKGIFSDITYDTYEKFYRFLITKILPERIEKRLNTNEYYCDTVKLVFDEPDLYTGISSLYYDNGYGLSYFGDIVPSEFQDYLKFDYYRTFDSLSIILPNNLEDLINFYYEELQKLEYEDAITR